MRALLAAQATAGRSRRWCCRPTCRGARAARRALRPGRSPPLVPDDRVGDRRDGGRPAGPGADDAHCSAGARRPRPRPRPRAASPPRRARGCWSRPSPRGWKRCRRPATDRLAYLGEAAEAATQRGSGPPRGRLGAGDLLRLSRPRRATWSRTGARGSVWPTPARKSRLRWSCSPTRSRRTPRASNRGVRAAGRREPRPGQPGELATAVARTLPDGAIVVDESITSGCHPPPHSPAARHTLLTLTGGAIGQGIPVATGAAIAAPDRPVLHPSEARRQRALHDPVAVDSGPRNVDVTTVSSNNSAYAILRMELARTGAGDTPGTASARDARPVRPHARLRGTSRPDSASARAVPPRPGSWPT